MPNRQIDAVLFDLDGTLIDTAPDLAGALNATLVHFNKPVMPFSDIRPVVSHGARGLINLGFNIDTGHTDFDAIREFLLDYYANNLATHSALFDGMENLLSEIESSNRTWGVVTNKPGWLTEPLMKALKLETRAAVIVSGDTTEHRKPHPQPLYFACDKININAERCVYFGDAERDIAAGNTAGMKTLAAKFGYISSTENLEAWQPNHIVDTPMDAWPHINQ